MKPARPGYANPGAVRGAVRCLRTSGTWLTSSRSVLAVCCCVILCAAASARQKSPAEADSARSQATAEQSEAADKATAERDVNVGSFYMHKGDYAAALSRFEEAARLDPKNGKARLLLAESHEKEGDRSAAVKCYQDYLREFPHARDQKKIRKKIAELTRAGD